MALSAKAKKSLEAQTNGIPSINTFDRRLANARLLSGNGGNSDLLRQTRLVASFKQDDIKNAYGTAQVVNGVLVARKPNY